MKALKACLLSLLLMSCGVMPVVVRDVDPVPFQTAELASIEPGRTDRAALREQLGAPTVVRSDGRLWVYASAVITGRVRLAGSGSAYDHYYLFVDLDADGTVTGYEVASSRLDNQRNTRGAAACRADGICVVVDPWEFTTPPPWDPLGNEVLPDGVDIAVLTDTAEADALAKSFAPSDEECAIYVWGQTGSYTSAIHVAVDDGDWRALAYHRVMPDSQSLRTFIWQPLSQGPHRIRAAVYADGRRRDTGELDIDCRPATRIYAHVHTKGGMLHGPRLAFEFLPEETGRQELARSRLILE